MNNIPNKETLAAMEESLRLLNDHTVKTYTVEEAMKIVEGTARNMGVTITE